MTKYYLYMRLNCGVRILEQITKEAANFWEEHNSFRERMSLATPTGTPLFVNVEQIAIAKVLVKHNPLEDPEHYDNALN